MPDRQAVEVDGHRLVLVNLDRLLFPVSGHTKAQLLHYYAQVAEVLLPHATGRPASFVRAPDGPGGQTWYAKRPPPGLPDWVTLAEVPGSEGPAPHVVVDSTAALMAMANLAAFEVHVPQWTARTGPDGHDRLVLDLDPGPGADLVLCCTVAQRLRQMLADDGLTAYPVSSGSKGLHLYAPLEPAPERAVSGYARSLAQRMQAEHPGLVTASMDRSIRPGKVFIDWSQNATHKTTACPYTLRLHERPRVAAPVGWDEIAGCAAPERLVLSPEQVVERVARLGDPLAELAARTHAAPLPR
ncbi:MULTISPECIES: non-homologous end-joining DNA ligase [Streptomycetaceae]|nr:MULTISPECIES: non-homologous end-joining DNA ligase [Streptomycetaceae]CCB78147.1 conserved protein of unknown function [Streptantibioticus cattleyicolor NRRL 8057 = DSM 46488]